MTATKDIPNAIKAARIDQKITQADLATMLGVSQQAVAKWEDGTSKPRRHSLKLLSAILPTFPLEGQDFKEDLNSPIGQKLRNDKKFRDRCAIEAMKVIIANQTDWNEVIVAEKAYDMAEAMLAARTRKRKRNF